MKVTTPRPRRLSACGIRRPSGVRITVVCQDGQRVRVLELRPPTTPASAPVTPEAA